MVEKPAPTVPVASLIQRQKVGSYSLGPVRYIIPEAMSEEDISLRVAPPLALCHSCQYLHPSFEGAAYSLMISTDAILALTESLMVSAVSSYRVLGGQPKVHPFNRSQLTVVVNPVCKRLICNTISVLQAPTLNRGDIPIVATAKVGTLSTYPCRAKRGLSSYGTETYTVCIYLEAYDHSLGDEDFRSG